MDPEVDRLLSFNSSYWHDVYETVCNFTIHFLRQLQGLLRMFNCSNDTVRYCVQLVNHERTRSRSGFSPQGEMTRACTAGRSCCIRHWTEWQWQASMKWLIFFSLQSMFPLYNNIKSFHKIVHNCSFLSSWKRADGTVQCVLWVLTSSEQNNE